MKRLLPLLIASLLFAAAPTPSEAQITTAVVPPRPERPAEDPVAERVRRTERLERRITEMRAWVDSVAVAVDAEPTIPDTAGAEPGAAADPETMRPVAAPPRRERAERPRRTETTVALAEPRQPPPPTRRFREGAPAPATATPLPLLAMLGAAALVTGAFLRRRT